ncbi:MAG: biliverdin-producing heme oxygenase [Geminicoccaceae bacterium]|nr:biliverdin-producing heme oxygenase [Geminicoccaceae bacterium]
MVAPPGSIARPHRGTGEDFAETLRKSTRALHRMAERSGVIAELLAGRVRPSAYLLFAFNLLPIYRALEAALAEHRLHPALAGLWRPELARAEALARDVAVLAAQLPDAPLRLLAPSERYRRRIEAVAADRPERLLAHGYVRHLGDLSGGQVLARLLARTPGIGAEAVGFYAFPGLADLGRAKEDYRRAIARAELQLVDRDGVIEEAREAFRLNIALSEAVAAAAPGD